MTLRALAWGNKVSVTFARIVTEMCGRLGIPNPSWLMGCMAFETGRTFRADVQNALTKATGLIQFMPTTAIGMGTTVDYLAKLTPEEQLVWVEKYFEPYRGRLKTLSDLYMAILWPTAVGAPEDAVIFDSSTKAYLQNRGLDINKDGGITKAEATAFVARLLDEGLQPENALQTNAPVIDESRTAQPSEENKMDPLSIFAMFGPMIAQLIPQLGKLFVNPEDKKQARNMEAINLVLDTFTKAALGNPAASGTNVAQVAQAVEAVKQDPLLKQEVTKAVLTEPAIMAIIEVGGGIAKAREYDLQVMSNEKPFWKTSAVFWVSIILLPMIYWYVGSSIAGGIAIPESWPWYAQLPLRLLGVAWDAGARVGLANLVVGLVLGGICGVFYGVSVTQAKQQLERNGNG